MLYYVSESISFNVEYFSIAGVYHILFIHQLVDICIVFTFWLLCIVLPLTLVYKFCVGTFSFPLGIYLGLELLDHITVGLTF